eukprot:750937-Hanusia_phi.AAC.7
MPNFEMPKMPWVIYFAVSFLPSPRSLCSGRATTGRRATGGWDMSCEHAHADDAGCTGGFAMPKFEMPSWIPG